MAELATIARPYAEALFKGCEEGRLGLLECTPMRHNGPAAALGEKLIERETETALAAIGIDGRLRVVRRHQRLDGRSADALGAGFAGKFLFPGGIAK